MLIRRDRTLPSTLDDLLGPSLAGSLDRLDVRSRKILVGKLPGERRSKKRGQSVEFDDYREYVPGDDLRHCDWNVFARTDRFFIKLFREDEDLALHVLLDRSPSMDAATGTGPTKRLVAHRIAMALAYIGLVRQNRVYLSAFGPAAAGETPSLWRLGAMRGRRSVARAASFIVDGLAGEPQGVPRAALPDDPDDPSGINAAIRRTARDAHGVVVVLSDFLATADFKPALNALAAVGRTDAAFVQVLTPAELDPALEAERGLTGDLALTDVETGRRAEVTLSPAAIRAYRARAEQRVGALAQQCAARNVDHLLHKTDDSVEDLVVGGFRRQGLLG